MDFPHHRIHKYRSKVGQQKCPELLWPQTKGKKIKLSAWQEPKKLISRVKGMIEYQYSIPKRQGEISEVKKQMAFSNS